MKKFFKFLIAVLFAALLMASCDKEKKASVVLVMTADAQFTDNIASLNFALSAASAQDVSISLAVLDSPSEGNSSVPADKLNVPSSVVVSAGSTSLKLDVQLDEDATGSEAVIAVTGVSGATLQGDGVVRIKTGQQYNGEGGGGGGGTGDDNLQLQLQSNWSVSFDPVNLEYDYDDEGYLLFFVDLVAPGSSYVWVDTYTDSQLQQYYKGDIAAMLNDYSSDFQEAISKGYSASDILYTTSDGYATVYYDEPGPTKFYIMDFDAKGKPTGKYGVVTLTVPEYDEGGEGGGGEGGDDDDESYDQISVSGTGSALFTFDIYPSGTLTAENLQDKMLETGQWVVDQYNLYVAFGEAGLATLPDDFNVTYMMSDADYPYIQFGLQELGNYDVLIVGMNAEGNLTGEYNISTIEIDGHELAAIQGARRKLAAKAGKSVRRAEDDGIDGDGDDITITIAGELKKMDAWKATYDGRHIGKSSGGEGGEGGDDPTLLGPLTLQTSWKATYSGNYRIDVTGVTDTYFMFDIYDEPFSDSELAAGLIDMVSYNLSEYGYVYNGPDDYDTWTSLESGTYYVYIAGLDANYDLTGNYAVSTIKVGSGGAVVGGGEDMVGARRKLHRRIVSKAFIRKK